MAPLWPLLGTIADEPEAAGCAPLDADEPEVADMPEEPPDADEPVPAAVPEAGIAPLEPAPPLDAVEPAGCVVELPEAPEDCDIAPDDPPAEEPCVGAGCMAGEPEVVVPVPEAVGRSVPADGAGWASAGAATKIVAIRQAAICVLSMLFSCNGFEIAFAQIARRANALRRILFRLSLLMK
jgi:hypothetical protein